MLRCMLNDSLPNGFLIALFAPFDDQVTPFVGPGTINKYISDLYPLVNTPFFFPLATISIAHLWLHRANPTY